METVFHKNLSQKISQLPEDLAQKVSEYIDILLYKTANTTEAEKEMTPDEFRNWVEKAEQGENLTLEEFKSKWESKENEILNRTN